MASRFRLLLDQNFPNPPGFDVAEIDDSVEVVHLGVHDPTLTAGGTPDWVIYLRAAQDGFDALVTRDVNQTELPEEMLVLTRVRLTLVAFRDAVEDPIVEWGQLLAYLPLVRRRNDSKRSQIVLLPRPALSAKNELAPREALSRIANDLGVAVGQIRRDAEESMRDHLGRRNDGHALLGLMKWR